MSLKLSKILFVCHGNICRSPTAQFVFSDMLKKRGLFERFTVLSAATATTEIRNGIGDPVYPPARAELERHGLSCEGKRAVLLTREDYDKYDLIICMDNRNLNDMKPIIGEDTEEKVHLLMEYTERGGEVSDPWFTERFDVAYRDIYDGCTGLLEYILKVNGEKTEIFEKK